MTINFARVVLLALLVVPLDGPRPAIAQGDRIYEIKSDIVTLYARDPLAKSFCFGDASYGRVFQQGEVRNRCSDIDFGGYARGAFSVGVEGARKGVVLDLGTPDDLRKRYGFTETVGGGQGFASLHVAGSSVLVKGAGDSKLPQELREGRDLFSDAAEKAVGMATTPVKLGHIYLLRLTDGHDASYELIVKLLVVAYTPDEVVTIRWQVLRAVGGRV